MKKIIISFAVLAYIVSTAFVAPVCNENEFFLQGVKSKMGYYKANGDQTGSGISEVTKVYTSGDSTIAVVKSTYEDAKKKEPHTSEVKMICLNGAFIMDMSGVAGNASQQSGHDAKMVCSGNLVAYKSSYTVGEKLGDINMTMEMYSDGKLTSTTIVKITDRVVERYEDLTVPAGTFKCYKIAYTSSSTMMIGSMKMPSMRPHNSIMYYSPKAGLVRMEEYKEDKLLNYNQLLELKKP
jgi:hypothetical protein